MKVRTTYYIEEERKLNLQKLAKVENRSDSRELEYILDEYIEKHPEIIKKFKK